MSLELAKYSKKVDGELEEIDIRYRKTQNTAIDGEHLFNAFQQMFSTLADPKQDGLYKLSMEKYTKYKKSYIKHLQFNPEVKNLSKFSISSASLYKLFTSS